MGTRLVGWHNDCSVDDMGHRRRHSYRIGHFGRRIDFLATSSWVCARENAYPTMSDLNDLNDRLSIRPPH